MIKATVKVTSRIPDVIKAIERATQQGLTAGAEMIEGEAKRTITENKSVDTGRLRGSLSYSVSGSAPIGLEPVGESQSDDGVRKSTKKSALIGTNVYYGKYVEFGTEKAKGKPFLRPAFDANVTKIKALFRGLYARAVK